MTEKDNITLRMRINSCSFLNVFCKLQACGSTRRIPVEFILLRYPSPESNTSLSHRSHTVIQNSDISLKPSSCVKKQPSPLQRVRQHGPGEIFLRERTANSEVKLLLVPFEIWLRYRPVPARHKDGLHNLVLGFADEVEE